MRHFAVRLATGKIKENKLEKKCKVLISCLVLFCKRNNCVRLGVALAPAPTLISSCLGADWFWFSQLFRLVAEKVGGKHEREKNDKRGRERENYDQGILNIWDPNKIFAQLSSLIIRLS